MKNENDVKEWIRFADMDVLSANYLNEIQHSKPLEIICYHCQQASEKILKSLVIAFDGELQKTHDLGLLTEQLSEYISIPDNILDAADELTPYGVKIRYPQELNIEEIHVSKALSNMQLIYEFVSKEIKKLEKAENEN